MSEQKFKLVKSQGEFIIFPQPVEKGNKYLIKNSPPLFAKGADVLVSALNEGFLPTPKEDTEIYEYSGVHDDGQTPVYEIQINDLVFNFLSDKDIDPKKSEGVEKVLSNKVIALMLASTDDEFSTASKELKKRYNAQTQCSTCQKMGIQSEKLKQWIESICQ